MIQDLEAKIAGIRAREERRKARRDPAVRQVLVAVKACDKALGESRDPVLRGAVEEARVGLAACLGTHGIVMPQVGAAPKPRGRRSRATAVRDS